MDDLESAPSKDIDPYAVLGIPESASATEVKSAYRKLALKHHPDKVPSSEKEASKAIFQEIVSAYAVLSDERRRKRYDTTGNTSESLELDDDDFDWLDFFRDQWEETVTSTTILNHKEKYQGSSEEKRDVIAAYTKWQGNLTRVFEEIMLCNVLDDEGRFRKWIDEEIAANRVENYDTYRLESESSKKKRRKAAEREAREAEAYLSELNNKKKKEKKQAKNDMGDLASMIQQRQQSRATNFLDDLEAKYAPKQSQGNGANGRKRKADEPSEEAFQETARKLSKAKVSNNAGSSKTSRRRDEQSEDRTIDLGEETGDSDSEGLPEPTLNKKSKRVNRKASGAAKRGRQSKY